MLTLMQTHMQIHTLIHTLIHMLILMQIHMAQDIVILMLYHIRLLKLDMLKSTEFKDHLVQKD